MTMRQGKSSLVEVILLLLLASVIISALILSSVPPISKDALVHHLAVPKLYLQHGGIYEIPAMPFSYYPMNLHLLYMIPLYFGNDIIPKFIHFSFALLTAWLIFGYLRRRLNRTYALFGAILFLSLPLIFKLAITVYVDLGVIFFSTASLLLLLRWIESRFRPKFLILSGILCGLALGTKYNGLVSLFLLTLAVPFFYSRYAQGERSGFFKSLSNGIIFLFISLLVYSPWMIRNYLWTKNPIYPLYNGWFNPSPSLSKEIKPENGVKKNNRGLFTFRHMVYHEAWWQIALIPVRIFFQGKDGDPRYFDGKLNPFLLILPIFAFFRIREGPSILKTEKKIFLGFTVLFFGFAFFSSVMRIRYIAPMIPSLVILSVFGLKNVIDLGLGFRGRIFPIGALIFVLSIGPFLLNALYISEQFKYVNPFRYLNGSLNRDEYIARYRPEYPAMSFINKNLDPGAKIFFIFLGKRGYYCDKEYMFDMGMLKNLIKKSKSPKNILQGLRKQEITHLLVYYHLFERWMKDNFSNDKILLTQQFFKVYVGSLFHEKGFGVLVLRDDMF